MTEHHNNAARKTRQEIAAWYEADGVADRFARYQQPGTETFRYRSAERRAVEGLLATLPGNLTVIDLPCGTGRYLPLLERFERVVAADAAMEMLLRARAALPDTPLPLCQADVYRLPFPDQAFDLTFCLRFLHHVPDDASRERALAELGRITGSYLLVSYFERRSLKHGLRRLRAWRRRRRSMRFAVTFARLGEDLGRAGLVVERHVVPFPFFSENRLLLCRKV